MNLTTDTASFNNPQSELCGDSLRRAVQWIVDPDSFDDIKQHGNAEWKVDELILLAAIWVWSDKPTLTGAFEQARHWVGRNADKPAFHSYQGLLKALTAYTPQLLPRLWERMQTLMQQHGESHFKIGKWTPLAADGSRVTTPRSKSNERAFCSKTYGQSAKAKLNRKKKNKNNKNKKKKTKKSTKKKLAVSPVKPQIWVTLLWHMGLHMPWSWRTGPSYSSEREHLQEIIKTQTFPENTLFCADAGFIGYDFWKTLIDHGHHFLIRVGGNVHLLRKLGYVREREGIVYCWPEKAAQKKQPPLVLRLITVQLGRGQAYLLTNVLDESELSIPEALQLYKLRWGVELQFRTFKQTYRRRMLRCRDAQRALVEFDWSMLGLWMVQLLAMKEQTAAGAPPEGCSVQAALSVVRQMIERWYEQAEEGDTLWLRLKQAVKDNYQRHSSKAARFRPRAPDRPAAGKPKIRDATQKDISALKKYVLSTPP